MAIQNDGGGKYVPNVKPKGAQSLKVVPHTRAPITRDNYTVTPASAPAPIPYGGSGGGGIGGGSFGAAGMSSEADFLAGDSGYQAQLAALMKALQNTNSEFDRNLQTYETDYGTALGSLGFGDTDPMAEGDQLGWMTKDLNTSAGRGTESVTNDFAGRGALQSSHYARALDNLMRSLNDQKTSMDTGRQRFRDDIAAKRSAYGDENKAAQGSARAEALARRAMSYTSV